jgi:hypothetical protein
MVKQLGWVGVIALTLCLPARLDAQTAQVGSVTGEVVDSTGAPLPGATVTLLSTERGVSRSAVTDASGVFRFQQVQLGLYDVTATLTGFQSRTVTNNRVETERTTNVSVRLNVAGTTETVDVIGDVPIVDQTNQTVQLRIRSDEFQNLPAGRSYQSLIGAAPGVVGTGNVNAHGALTSNNQFMFDGVVATDTVTGTFSGNLNFEAIQEVVVRTAGVSAEFGRSTGAYVDVVTKSGTNRFSGSYKLLAVNDQWDVQNSTKSEVATAGVFPSLARTRFDKVNKTNTFTVGGPIIRNRAWFFVAWERAITTTPTVQLNARPGITPEEFQQNRNIKLPNYRFTYQISPSQSVWVKFAEDPFTGIVRNDYWNPFFTAERAALTAQSQGGKGISGQYTAVIGSQLTAEVIMGRKTSRIDVEPFERTTLNNGAPYWDLNDNRIYNGATFDGYVSRPRTEVGGAINYFTRLGGKDHQFKVGVDFQRMESENLFRYPNNQIFYGFGFNPATRRFDRNDSREDYDEGPSTSKGDLTSFYVRDKMSLGRRFNAELGLRIEKQSGTSDTSVPTVATTNVAPRLSFAYALTDDGKTLVNGSYGRFYDGILQGFSDTFAAVPQQTNYNTYIWNGSAYVFSSRSEAGASTFKPDTKVTPRNMDEVTFGGERQIGQSIGASVRYIHRSWGNFIDDIRTFNANGTLNRVVANISSAERSYKGIEFLLDKRFSNRWAATASYTFSKAKGNHFGDDFTALEDFAAYNCRQTADSGLFNAGNFPCSEVAKNYQGLPTYDRPHMFKYSGSYVRPIGPVDLTAGVIGSIASKRTYSKSRTISVLSPVTNAQFATMTYFYEPRGSSRVSGLADVTDFSLDIAWKAVRTSRFGIKVDVFNLFNNEEKLTESNTAWCNATVTAACQTAVANFGTATTRGSFQTPRQYRFSFVVRY